MKNARSSSTWSSKVGHFRQIISEFEDRIPDGIRNQLNRFDSNMCNRPWELQENPAIQWYFQQGLVDLLPGRLIARSEEPILRQIHWRQAHPLFSISRPAALP
jgi:hypothetical protein